jgi:hypothetical protein
MADLPPGVDKGAVELPATFVNHMQVSRLGLNLLRIAFGEATTPDFVTYRTAVLMGVEDAQLLVQLVKKLLNTPLPPPAAPTSRPN